MSEFKITKFTREVKDGTLYVFQEGEKISLDLAVKLGLAKREKTASTAKPAAKEGEK